MYKDDDGEEVEVMFIELVDRKNSGFIQDGTENTTNPIVLNSPSQKYIANQGWRKATKVLDGKTVSYNERIRYIRNEKEISVERQKLLGIEPSSLPKEDKIVIAGGEAVIARVRGNEGLFDFLKDVFYNESNPDRSPKATAVYRVIEKDKEAEEEMEDDIALADCLTYLNKLSQKVGDKSYRYNEEKIDGLCQLFTVFADTSATKLRSLIAFAKTTPYKFMQAVEKWEQVTQTEITHALQLNVVKFEGNVFQYAGKDKIIKSLGSEKMKQDEKISRAADWFKTPDGNEAYTEFRAELEAAKDKK
jgi:hypothetical protein